MDPSRPKTLNVGRSGQYRSRHGRKEVGFIGQAGWASSVVNLLNTIVGAGVLAMPLALSRMGILLGVLVILWSGVAAGFGLYLQTLCARYLDRGSASFFALSQITYPNAAVIFDAAIAIKCFGVGVSYLIIIGDLMPGVVRAFSSEAIAVEFLVDRHFWITAFMLVVIPLAFLRRLDSLKYTSVIALISIGYLVILVVAHFVKGDASIDRGPLRVVHWQSGIATLSSLPVIVFAYTCHQNMFSILNEIGNNSHFRTTGVVFASIGVAASIYILVAITGYMTFGDDVGGNIVALYASSITATIGKIAIVVLVMFSYPLQVHPCRASVDAVLKWRPHRRKEGTDAHIVRSPVSPRPATKARPEGMTELRFAFITTTIIVLSYIVAMTVSSLEKVLAYVGSTGSTSISFILPGLFYYKISSPDSPLHQRLMKENDDEEGFISSTMSQNHDNDDDDSSDTSPGPSHPIHENEGLLQQTTSTTRFARTSTSSKSWRRWLLRRLSLGLAAYGLVVMITCLVTNIFSAVAVH